MPMLALVVVHANPAAVPPIIGSLKSQKEVPVEIQAAPRRKASGRATVEREATLRALAGVASMRRMERMERMARMERVEMMGQATSVTDKGPR